MQILRRAFRVARRVMKKQMRLTRAQRLGILYAPPNYIYRNAFTEQSIVIDVGCADDADFSVHLIERFGLKSFVVDPTRKHASALAALEKRFDGRLKHLPCAVAAESRMITFYESEDDISGSILRDHQNVARSSEAGRMRSYDVEALTPRGVLERVGVDRAELLKLDVEGAEYALLAEMDAEDLARFDQVFVEYHHHAVARYTIEDTQRSVQAICGMGFRSFTLDDQNYLFFR